MILGLGYKLVMGDISGGNGTSVSLQLIPVGKRHCHVLACHSGVGGIDINHRIIFIKPLATISYEKRFD